MNKYDVLMKGEEPLWSAILMMASNPVLHIPLMTPQTMATASVRLEYRRTKRRTFMQHLLRRSRGAYEPFDACG